jgi:hypothetical protein
MHLKCNIIRAALVPKRFEKDLFGHQNQLTVSYGVSFTHLRNEVRWKSISLLHDIIYFNIFLLIIMLRG